MNTSSSYTFLNLESPMLQLPICQPFNLLSYQQIPFQQCFWVDHQILFQPTPSYLTYGLNPYVTTEMSFYDSKVPFAQSNTEQTDIFQGSGSNNQLHFYPFTEKCPSKEQNQVQKKSGAFSFYSNQQQNHKLDSQNDKEPIFDNQQLNPDLNNQIPNDDKKIIQNLRYQRKNIQANIVNKIYTYLKASLKFGNESRNSFALNKEKAIIYFKVLEKLEKAKKQNVKRQFLKGLLDMSQSLPGYSKISKQLQKKGQSIQQFEYYIRVIIKNYLRLDAINSVLTSKKMNPSLWKDHLRKLRQLQEYLFSTEQKQILE